MKVHETATFKAIPEVFFFFKYVHMSSDDGEQLYECNVVIL